MTRLPMRHPLLKVLLLSSALTLPVASAQAGTAAAAARVTARADEAAAAAKGETKTKTETKATPKSAKSADASKTQASAQASAKSKTGTAKTSESDKPSIKSKASAKTKTAETDETESKKGKAAQSGKPSGKSKPTQTADTETKKSTTSKKAAKQPDTVKDDEKVTATASAKGTPYVMPDKGDKYDSRKSGTLSAPAKTAAKTPAPKPADKVVAQTTQTPKPRPATTPATTATSASHGTLTTDAGKAVDDLFGAKIKVDGQPVPHNPTPTPLASSEAVKPTPKTEDRLDLPTAPIPYQATVKPETAPAPKADLNAAITAEKVEPRTVSPPTPDKAADVVATASLPVTPPPTPTNAPTLSVPEAVRQPVETPAAPRNLASVTVDAYARDYEGQKTGAEMRYDSSIRSGLLARQSRAGDLEGNWLVSSLTGDKLVSLALRGGGAQVDGAWRSLQGGVGLNRSGLIESAMQTDDRLTLDYQSGSSRGRYRLDLRREPDGRWRGQMIDPAGTATPVVMQAQ
ncbi:hypothetical protein [Asticcacaulis sp.]|uniref:hypothetical protein n=1 Tax=Asticcacaulis sp. TaxID=1872648 RepID=UPI00262B422F|nr:hypothetical protein [Asticcacaulis sp.]